MGIDAILFDFGDTLASLNPARERILRQYLRGKGIRAGLREIRAAYRIVEYHHKQSAIKIRSEGQRRRYLVNLNLELLKALGLSTNANVWAPEIYRYFGARKKWAVFADVVPALRAIKRMKIPTAILANWNIHLKELVEEVGIESYFDRVHSSAELGMEKPDPRVFRRVVGTLGASPARTVYVGNEYETDVVGSREAGLVPVLVDRFNHWPQADCVRIRGLARLSRWITTGEI